MTQRQELRIHLSNNKALIVNHHIQATINHVRWAKRTGNPLELEPAPGMTRVIFPDCIIGYTLRTLKSVEKVS